MQIGRVFRAILFVGVWAYAGATWGSIGHHLVGLPDVTPLAATAFGVAAGLWTIRPARSTSSAERIQVRDEKTALAR